MGEGNKLNFSHKLYYLHCDLWPKSVSFHCCCWHTAWPHQKKSIHRCCDVYIRQHRRWSLAHLVDAHKGANNTTHAPNENGMKKKTWSWSLVECREPQQKKKKRRNLHTENQLSRSQQTTAHYTITSERNTTAARSTTTANTKNARNGELWCLPVKQRAQNEQTTSVFCFHHDESYRICISAAFILFSVCFAILQAYALLLFCVFFLYSVLSAAQDRVQGNSTETLFGEMTQEHPCATGNHQQQHTNTNTKQMPFIFIYLFSPFYCQKEITYLWKPFW